MSQSGFGICLHELRKRHSMTQKELADHIKRTDMYISGMETGKNGPPKEKDLKNIVKALELTSEEEFELRCNAAFDRGTLPDNLMKVVKRDSRVLNILYELKDPKKLDKNYEKIMNILKFGSDTTDV